MNALVSPFLKITALVTIAIVLLVVAAFLLKIVIFAAIVAALVIGGLFLYNLIRRRSGVPVNR